MPDPNLSTVTTVSLPGPKATPDAGEARDTRAGGSSCHSSVSTPSRVMANLVPSALRAMAPLAPR